MEEEKRKVREEFWEEFYSKNYEAMKQKIEKGLIDINIENMEGTMLLQHYEIDLDFIKYIVGKGADLTIEDWEYGGTVLSLVFFVVEI